LPLRFPHGKFPVGRFGDVGAFPAGGKFDREGYVIALGLPLGFFTA
jgi:hypothetical protein